MHGMQLAEDPDIQSGKFDFDLANFGISFFKIRPGDSKSPDAFIPSQQLSLHGGKALPMF
jgi:hypothetical protein